MALVSFSGIAGTELRFDRTSHAEYGTAGRPVTVRATAAFRKRCEIAFAELWSIAGRADLILTAGAYTNKPGFHGKGRAFDLDGVFWPGGKFVTRWDGFQGRDRDTYYGVEAVMRRHFGVVLDYHWNAAHQDHFHLDDSLPVRFTGTSRSVVLGAQGMLNHFWGAGLVVDGDYGPKTQRALRGQMKALGLGAPSTPVEWKKFLLHVARRGLSADA